jgi:sarcosine oxidase
MNSTGIAGAVLGKSGEGLFDPYALLQAFRRKSKSLGVTFVADEVVGFTRSGAMLDALCLKAAGRFPCDIVINAAGPQAGVVARMAGIDLPVRPYKADTFVFKAQKPVFDCPVVIDPNGLHLRPEGQYFICSMPRRDEWGDDTDNFEVDYGQFEDMLWPALAARVPQFETLKLMRAWAGHMELNTFDWNPILGLHPDCANLIFANGFSGHGAQHMPAVGRAIAELVTTGRYQTLDLSRLGFSRIFANKPLLEHGPH